MSLSEIFTETREGGSAATLPLAAPGTSTSTSTVALVVDDILANRVMLRAQLEGSGFAVVEAADGIEAIEVFEATQPDIVFMDVLMPRMDGIEATRRLKALCGNEFVPVIFLTAVTDEETLAECILCGGDDFLNRPYSQELLATKIRAMGRMRDLQRSIGAHFARQRRDEEIAEQVFAGAVTSGNVENDAIRSVSRAAATFSGDVMLTARAPSGDLHLLLGDFTGHGLAAALGALPASEAFRAMTRKGFSIEQIRDAIDRKLSTLLPTGMFMAAHLVALDNHLEQITFCNSGMPEALVVDGSSGAIRRRIPSSNLALGVLPSAAETHLEHMRVREGDRIVLASDGVTEAMGTCSEQFGNARYEAAIGEVSRGGWAIDRVVHALDAFCGDADAEDDVTLVEVRLLPVLLPETDVSRAEPPRANPLDRPHASASGEWEVTMTLRGTRLREIDPIPLILSQLQEFGASDARRAALFTVLSELYVNALDHGVLGLDSGLKSGPHGFQRYLDERARRLASCDDGEVRVAVHAGHEHPGQLRIRVEDSGNGFDPDAIDVPDSQPIPLHGRGLALVRELCERVEIDPPGNRIEVLFTG